MSPAELARSNNETGGGRAALRRPEQTMQLWFWLAALLFAVFAVALLKDILLPFVAAIVIAYFLNPIADWLEAGGLKRAWSATLIVGLAAVAVSLALVLLVPLLITQLRELAVGLPSELERLKAAVEMRARVWLGPSFPSVEAALERAATELSQNWAGALGTVMASVWSRGLAIVNFLSLLLITPVVVFYLLVDWNPMLERIDKCLPRDHAPTIRRLASDMNDAIAAFIRGQGAICLILAFLYAVGLSWVGLNYGLLIGLSTGVLAFVPVIGWLLGFVIATAVALVQFWPHAAPIATVAAVLIGGLAIDAAVLSPRLVGQKVGLHPVWMIFALFAFSYLFGLVGTLVAVPLAAAIAVLVRFAVQRYLESSVYKGEGGTEPHRGSSGKLQ
jgi:predicted PurR-regulated permease PerM